MRLVKECFLGILVTLALIGCQSAPATPVQASPPTKAPPTPTKPPPAPTPTPLPLINANSAQVPTPVAPEVPRITIDELKALLSSPRNMLIVDTREPGAFETAHIRGAINVPYNQIEAIAPQLSRSAKIVFYCA